eukprot:1195109-Prorocentrum_minimum.AAC.1
MLVRGASYDIISDAVQLFFCPISRAWTSHPSDATESRRRIINETVMNPIGSLVHRGIAHFIHATGMRRSDDAHAAARGLDDENYGARNK